MDKKIRMSLDSQAQSQEVLSFDTGQEATQATGELFTGEGFWAFLDEDTKIEIKTKKSHTKKTTQE